jgi:hypothetical protein
VSVCVFFGRVNNQVTVTGAGGSGTASLFEESSGVVHSQPLSGEELAAIATAPHPSSAASILRGTAGDLTLSVAV